MQENFKTANWAVVRNSTITLACDLTTSSFEPVLSDNDVIQLTLFRTLENE